MKKYLVLAVLLVISAAVFAQKVPEWKVTGTEGGSAAKDNSITLKKGENYVYIYFKAAGVDFDKIRLDFTISNPLEVIWQCVYQPGATLGSEQSIGVIDKGPIETSFENFTKKWFGSGPAIASKLTGICLKVNDTVGKSVFKLTDVQWVGQK
jgi:hypothetical protein